MYREKIDAFIEAKEQDMLDDLGQLIRINSVMGEPSEGKPFGEGPAAVVEAAGQMMAKYGLKVTNYDNYVVTGDFDGEGDKALDILAHLDVVPVTENWSVTQPFEPKVVDGRIYGRGSADDKGPAIAALYAIRAVRELGIPLKRGVRLILGANEENGSDDLAYYYAREQEAEYTFTPDADYPLINLEKGRLGIGFLSAFSSQTEGPALVRLDAGTAVNVVPADAEAVVSGLTAQEVEKVCKVVSEDTSAVYSVEETEEGVLIRARGTAAHGSTPELGLNAITALIRLLNALPLADGDCKVSLAAIDRLFPHGDTEGTSLGVNMRDEISGALTMNLGILHMDQQGLKGEFDSRCPVCANDDNVTAVIREKMKAEGLKLDDGVMTPPHYVSPDSVLVKTLLGCYEEYFGCKGEPMAIGGGTYVHHLERGVAFGCMVPEVDNHMHGDDEFMEIEMLKKSARIFAKAIVDLCG